MDRRFPPTIRWPLLLAAAALLGCDAKPPPAPSADPPADASTQFDSATAGSVTGRVTWAGDVPAAPPFHAPVSPLGEQTRGPKRDWPNPNAPLIDAQNHGVADAVVFLRGVDPRRARPWDLEPVHVELRDYQIHIRQGDADGGVGFVRRGDKVVLQSKQNWFHALQARGADFFGMTLPDEGAARERVLGCDGVVELVSNAGQFWMRGYLFVDEHPYYARTAADGRFLLPEAPAGDYDLVCWMRDWREGGHEIDADTRLVTHLTFRPPLQVVKRVHVEAGQTATADFTLSVEQFDREK